MGMSVLFLSKNFTVGIFVLVALRQSVPDFNMLYFYAVHEEMCEISKNLSCVNGYWAASNHNGWNYIWKGNYFQITNSFPHTVHQVCHSTASSITELKSCLHFCSGCGCVYALVQHAQGAPSWCRFPYGHWVSLYCWIPQRTCSSYISLWVINCISVFCFVHQVCCECNSMRRCRVDLPLFSTVVLSVSQTCSNGIWTGASLEHLDCYYASLLFAIVTRNCN